MSEPLTNLAKTIMSQTRLKPVCKNYALLLSLIGLISFSGCNGQKENHSSEKGLPYIIDLEQCMDTKQAMKISDIADTVEYVELKAPEDVPITRVWNIIPVDDFWVIHSHSGIYKFTNKGEYIKGIGRYGQGPGEYSTIYSVDVDYARKEIVINDSGHLIFYDLDGNYLRMEKKSGVLFNVCISDSILWTCEMGTNADKYIAFAMNYQRDIIDSIPNPFYGIESQDEGVGFHYAKLYKPFYRYKDIL